MNMLGTPSARPRIMGASCAAVTSSGSSGGGGGGAYDPSQTSGIVAWWDAQQASTVTADGSNRVGAWASRVNGYSAAQGTLSAKPVYVASGINLHPSMQLDGADDCLLCDAIAGTFNGNAGHTVFVVHKLASASGIYFNWGAGAGSGGNGGSVMGYNNAGSIVYERDDTVTLTYAVSGTSDTAPHALAYVSDGAAMALRQDGSPLATATATGSLLAPSAFRIGTDARGAGGYYYFGLIGEVIVYGRQLNATEIGQVEAYLAAKWGIATTTVAQPGNGTQTGF